MHERFRFWATVSKVSPQRSDALSALTCDMHWNSLMPVDDRDVLTKLWYM